MKQTSFEKTNWKHRFSHGGTLRKKRAGRGMRPLSSKDPLHLVFKANKEVVNHGLRTPKRFALIQNLVKKYSIKFFVKVEQISIQGDHVHCLIRTGQRTRFQSFFKVVAGQIAQQFQKEGLLSVALTGTPSKTAKLWKYRPFSRVVRGWKPYKTVRNYIQLNEKEARGEIPYRKQRLRGLEEAEWEKLWA